MDSKAKGKEGENRACMYLEEMGYEVLERNFRHSRSEIDVIALLQNQLLVFVEVKMRSRADYGEPEHFVDENQQEKIREAADHYIHEINWEKDIRFDIISIEKSGELRHI